MTSDLSNKSADPLAEFKKRLSRFASGSRGIRNPFVIVPVQPRYELRVADSLLEWVEDPHDSEDFPETGTAQVLRLDELFVETPVFDLAIDLGSHSTPETITDTMQDRLAEELVDVLYSQITAPEEQHHVVVLTHLGSLYPFTRASELLDELDRRNVQSTIGIPFPGDIVGGKLNFFGEESRNYYPAHQIEGRIEEEHLQ
ncbi:BREX protein BrxB domain-containing protein [Natronosalvus vescus]|uniref:BREX protein BrxB domain-containing protein n=1 Tax=Natronosalvus vescus TaxID=2953881 RepID=UPI00209096CC|nr:BREX protein BrxB domain-containing protein [Natronosalvus vescus]